MPWLIWLYGLQLYKLQLAIWQSSDSIIMLQAFNMTFWHDDLWYSNLHINMTPCLLPYNLPFNTISNVSIAQMTQCYQWLTIPDTMLYTICNALSKLSFLFKMCTNQNPCKRVTIIMGWFTAVVADYNKTLQQISFSPMHTTCIIQQNAWVGKIPYMV